MKLVHLYLACHLLTGCSLLTAAPSPQTPPPPISAVDRVLDATVALESVDGRSCCTASFVAGYVVTAAHCVDSSVVLLRLRDGRRAEATPVSIDPDTDVAALSLTTVLPNRVELPLAPYEAAPGDRVLAVGMPLQWRWFLTQGLAAGVRTITCGEEPSCEAGIAGTWLLHSAPTSYGNSGGPVLNEYGELVGITSWVKVVDGAPNHMSAAAPLAAIRASLGDS